MRADGTSAYDLQLFVASAMSLPDKKRTPLQRQAVYIHGMIKAECGYALAEDVSETAQGQIFILKAEHSYEDKSTVKLETDLASIIEEHSDK